MSTNILCIIYFSFGQRVLYTCSSILFKIFGLHHNLNVSLGIDTSGSLMSKETLLAKVKNNENTYWVLGSRIEKIALVLLSYEGEPKYWASWKTIV